MNELCQQAGGVAFQTHGGVATLSKSTGLSLRRNFTWNLCGNVIYAASQWGMVILLANLTSPAMLGAFALGLAIASPVFMFSGLALRPLQATDANHEYCFGHYLALRLLTSLFAMVALSGIVSMAGYPVSLTLVVLAVGLSKVLESISDVIFGLMQQQERMDRIARARIMKGGGGLAAMAILVVLTGDVLWGVLGMAGVWALVLLAYEVPEAAEMERKAGLDKSTLMGWWRLHPSFESGPLLRLAWLALPVGIVVGLASLQVTIPSYFVERYCGIAELGIFAALAYLIAAGNLLMASMAQACSPRMAKYYAEGNKAGYTRLLCHLVVIGLALGSGGVFVSMLGGRLLLVALYRPEYAEYLPLFRLLMGAGALAYLAAPLGYAMTAARYLRSQLPLFILACAATLGTAWFLIPSYGLAGAPLALMTGTLVQIAGSLAVVTHAVAKLRGTT